jgi:thioredoxin 1
VATVQLTNANFKDAISVNRIVLVCFYADWCPACRQFQPVFEYASERHQDLVFGTVDTEVERELSAQFQISSIPTLMIWKDWIRVFAKSGSPNTEGLAKLIAAIRGLDMDQVRARAMGPQPTTNEPGLILDGRRRSPTVNSTLPVE